MIKIAEGEYLIYMNNEFYFVIDLEASEIEEEKRHGLGN